MSDTTPLTRLLIEQIEQTGPISLADYMRIALGHPEHGYYTTRIPFGADGDFITAPEISQMFGELIGLWAVDMWAKLGGPAAFNLVELGPGRGTLMADLLRAASVVPDFGKAATVHFVEMSPTLRTLQAERVPKAHWADTLADLPEGPMILIANEFVDALPVRQFVRTDRGWFERGVSVSTERNLALGLLPAPVDRGILPPSVRDAREGSYAEICPAGLTIASEIADRLTAHAGAALLIDYGHARSATGDTVQAVHNHKYVDILTRCGEADITAHVDFEALTLAAKAATATRTITQGSFLHGLGIEARATALKTNATPEQAADIAGALKRLTGESEMGSLFKVMALTTPGAPAPAGF